MTNAEKTEGIKRDWAPIIVTTVVGILGSSIVASLSSSFLSEFGKPNVQVLIIPNKHDQHKVSFEITNPDGKTAATRLKLLLRTPENITHYSNVSSENMSI